jgi:hypothetical protein
MLVPHRNLKLDMCSRQRPSIMIKPSRIPVPNHPCPQCSFNKSFKSTLTSRCTGFNASLFNGGSIRKLGGQLSPASSLRFNRTSIRGVFFVCSYDGSSGMTLTFWLAKEAFGIIRMRRDIEGFMVVGVSRMLCWN